MGNIIIKGAIANYNDLTNREFLEILHRENPNLEYYHLQPPQGTVFSAGLDWAIIGNVASILGIVSFVWEVYSKIIAPERGQDSNNGIVINISGNDNQIYIGNNINSKEELEKQVANQLKDIQWDSIENEITQIKHSPMWEQIK